MNEGENREAARKTLREKSVFTFRPESQCRILLPRETTEQNGGWGHPWPLHLSQPALRLGMQMRAAPSLLPPYRVPFRVFHPFDITTSPTSSKVSRYRRISASATRRGLRFFCFLSSRKETVDKERNSYLLVVKKKKKRGEFEDNLILEIREFGRNLFSKSLILKKKRGEILKVSKTCKSKLFSKNSTLKNPKNLKSRCERDAFGNCENRERENLNFG